MYYNAVDIQMRRVICVRILAHQLNEKVIDIDKRRAALMFLDKSEF